MDYCSHISPPCSFFFFFSPARESLVFILGTYCLRKQEGKRKNEYKGKQAILWRRMRESPEVTEGFQEGLTVKQKSIPFPLSGAWGGIVWVGFRYSEKGHQDTFPGRPLRKVSHTSGLNRGCCYLAPHHLLICSEIGNVLAPSHSLRTIKSGKGHS